MLAPHTQARARGLPAWLAAGTHVKHEGRLGEGIALYERALSYAPRHADALYNLGVAYGEKGDLQVRARTEAHWARRATQPHLNC
jgi:tetratricopeptide (TPR) repeat protein